jgi:DNA-binding winged helix-turn-helix (wHTH) protein
MTTTVANSTLASRINVARQAVGDDGEEQRPIRTTRKMRQRTHHPMP